MQIADFERARREGMEFRESHHISAGVISVEGVVYCNEADPLHGVWDDHGRFWAFSRQPGDHENFLVLPVAPVTATIHAVFNDQLVIRTPFFDLRFGGVSL